MTYSKEETQLNAELERIAAIINTWDGEDARRLLPCLRQFERLRRQARKDGLDYCDSDNPVSLAIANAETRDDTLLPSPWNEESMQCICISDRKGQFITRDFFNEWIVEEWEDNVNCNFSEDETDTGPDRLERS